MSGLEQWGINTEQERQLQATIRLPEDSIRRQEVANTAGNQLGGSNILYRSQGTLIQRPSSPQDRVHGAQRFDRQGNNAGSTMGNSGLKTWESYYQSWANALRDRGGNIQSQWANIDIGNGYKINLVSAQKWEYYSFWQSVKDRQGNTLPINKNEYNQLMRSKGIARTI